MHKFNSLLFKIDNFYSLDNGDVTQEKYTTITQLVNSKHAGWVAIDKNCSVVGFLKQEFHFKLLFM